MRWLKLTAAGIVGIAVLLTLIAYLLLRGSLPQLDGRIESTSLSAPATIERDRSASRQSRPRIESISHSRRATRTDKTDIFKWICNAAWPRANCPDC